MRAIIDGKAYDTERAEEITRFSREVEQGPLFCEDDEPCALSHEFILYKTVRGEFFEYDTELETIALLTRKAVRALMQELNPDACGPLCWGA